VLVVSHDRYFLDRICDQIVAFEEAGIFVQPGNYSYYLEKQKERQSLRAAPWSGVDTRTKSKAEIIVPKSSRSRKLSFKEQRELAGMEDAILTAETRVAELERTLNDPEFHATRFRESAGLLKEMENLKSEVARLYERWHELDQIGK
jgi:ATP-binding cassette subfamily F protein uup